MSIFARTFEHVGLHHTMREEKPVGHLIPHRHFEMDLPADLGRAHLDVYQHGDALVTRLVNFRTGETAWYDVEIRPQDATVAIDSARAAIPPQEKR